MKKRFLFLVFALLTGFLPTMGETSDHRFLKFGKIWMEGGSRAQLIQCLHIEVTNTGPLDYRGVWYPIDMKKGNWTDVCPSTVVEVPAEETKDITIMFYFKEPGTYDLGFTNVYGDYLIFRCTLEIADYDAPKVKVSLQVDMLERAYNGYNLYGDLAHFRMTGRVTITNEGENTIFPRKEGYGYDFWDIPDQDIEVVVRPWNDETNKPYLVISKLESELKSGETITADFSYEFTEAPKEGKDYEIHINVLGETLTSIPFTVKQCTNTYWTADGHVKPLPVEGEAILKVPAEALAVDMRGQYEMDTFFFIDMSEASPNCLYYLGFLDNVPQGFYSLTNVIRDYEAKNLVIDADHDYYCPMPFKAKSALFKYTPVSESQGPARPNMTQMLSGALVLPFDVSQVSLNDMNGASVAEDGYNGDDLKVCRFIRDEEHVLYFQPVTEHQLNAYEPYLLYVKPSSLSFFAEDVTIPAIRQAVAQGNDYDFVGSTVAVAHAENVWQWNCDHYYFYQSETCELVRPFSAMMYGKSGSQSDQLTVKFIDSGASKVSELRMDSREKSKAVYSLSGQRVGTAEMKEKGITVQGLRPGLYIIGGRKVVVR